MGRLSRSRYRPQPQFGWVFQTLLLGSDHMEEGAPLDSKGHQGGLFSDAASIERRPFPAQHGTEGAVSLRPSSSLRTLVFPPRRCESSMHTRISSRTGRRHLRPAGALGFTEPRDEVEELGKRDDRDELGEVEAEEPDDVEELSDEVEEVDELGEPDEPNHVEVKEPKRSI